MKLEVGMYVRFKDKRGIEYIRKITSVNDTYPDKLYAGIYIDKEANNSTGVSLKNIIKASFNITDLIEEGDYVNGLRIEKNKYGELYTSYTYYGGDIGKQCEVYTNWLKEFKEDMIYNIVTKEQFEQMSYRLEN